MALTPPLANPWQNKFDHGISGRNPTAVSPHLLHYTQYRAHFASAVFHGEYEYGGLTWLPQRDKNFMFCTSLKNDFFHQAAAAPDGYSIHVLREKMH